MRAFFVEEGAGWAGKQTDHVIFDGVNAKLAGMFFKVAIINGDPNNIEITPLREGFTHERAMQVVRRSVLACDVFGNALDSRRMWVNYEGGNQDFAYTLNEIIALAPKAVKVFARPLL